MGIFSKFLKNDKVEKVEAREEKTEIKISTGNKKQLLRVEVG